MANLKSISLTFNTHNDDRKSDTVLHVFIKNRTSTTSTSESDTDFISNLLAFQQAEAAGPYDINPYLGCAVALSLGAGFGDPSSHEFNIPLRPQPIPLEEVILPVVNVHILPDVHFGFGGNDRWIFSYKIVFLFDDGRSFSYDSNTNGMTGIILDQDNRDYSGICTENPFNPQPAPVKYTSGAVLSLVTLEFYTHNDDKDPDTQLNVHLVNRLSASASTDIAIGLNLLKGVHFGDPSYNQVAFSGATLASSSIRLEDIVLPVVYINIGPHGNDRWIFDYRVKYHFSNGQIFSSTTSGIILDQDNHKHMGVYRGDSFPTLTPPTTPLLQGPPIDHINPAKHISLTFLEKKLTEFVNDRQGTGGQLPPINRIRLHHEGVFGSTLPASYYDLQSIDADPRAGNDPPADLRGRC